MALLRRAYGLGGGSNSVFSSASDNGTTVTSSSTSSSGSTGTSTSGNSRTTDYEITDSGNSTMKVVVRVRPENEMEIRSNFQSVVKTLDEHVLVFDPLPDNEPTFKATSAIEGPGGSLRRRPILGKKYKDLRFAFDHIFDETASQTDVFKSTTESIIEGVLDGINCSVFAYGATGAGKTHTMLGNQEYPGVMFYTMMELYRRIDELKDDKICEVAVSYCEVYNETIRDLLVPSAPLHLREDGQKGLVVAGLSRHTPQTANEILSMLEIGNQNRTQHPTDANATSSRSHAVFQVFVHQKARTAGLSAQVTSAKMSLIDLAGSERATVTTNRGARLREGANINKSLLALGNCINALAENKGKAVHVPYRNSKLTRLLKDSLGGNCRTVMIANVSPSGMSYEDTYNTLKYADRAKQIKTKLVRNVVSVDFHVTRYKTIVIELRREISELKTKLDNKSVLPSRQSYDSAEAFRLQNLIKAVYSERCRLRKQMAELDTSEREALLKVSRKERDIVRIDATSANETKKAKIGSRIEHLKRHVDDVTGQKEALNERLCANNESIGRVQAEVNAACGESNKPGVQALRQLLETYVEARKLEAENAHQWRLTKLLLKFIKNQEREISKSEKLLVFSLGLVQRQHTLIRASQILTPSLQESYDSLVRMAEGEKGVAWADQSNLSTDGLMDVSTSNFSQSQHAIFDSLLVSMSPRTRQSDIGVNSVGNSPFPLNTSLGILATSLTVANTPRSSLRSDAHETTPLSNSTLRATSTASVGVATPKSYHSEPRIPAPSSLFQRRTASQQNNHQESTPFSGFTANSPFIHRTTVSAEGVKCETSIGGVRAVAIASNDQSDLVQHSASKVQFSASTSGDNQATPLRMTAQSKMTTTSENPMRSGSKPSSPRSHYNLDEVDSRLSKIAAVSHSHYSKSSSGSDFSSQGSGSMYSTQCVVTNRHAHVGNCSPRKFSDPDVKSGLPDVTTPLHNQPPRPKSASELLRPKSTQAEESSGRLTAFTPLRGSTSDINKISKSHTPSHPSNSVGGARESHDIVGGPKEQRLDNADGSLACTRTDSGYSTTMSELSRNGNGTGEVASPYLVPRPGTGSKQQSDSHSSATPKRQPAFQIAAINTTTNSSQSCTFASLSSRLLPPHMSQVANAGGPSPSQQSLTLSMSSDTSSTHCVVDMNVTSRPRPAFQSLSHHDNKKSNSSPSSSSRLPLGSGTSISAPNVSSTPPTSSRDVRTMFLPTQKFCTFEDNFVPSSQSFGVPKTPVGATTNFGQSSPLHRRQLPPTTSSVSSRSNYLSTGYRGNQHTSPQHTSSYTRSPSHQLLTNPYSRSDHVGGDYYRDGAKSAPHYSSSRYRTDLPPQSPGAYTRFYPSRTCTISPDPPILTPPSPVDSCSDSMSDSTNASSHIYQSIEIPPPLPPPRTRNIYVPRPQGTSNTGSHTSSSYGASRGQSSYTNVVHTGSSSQSTRQYESSKKSSPSSLNETFTIESSPSHTHKTSPYHHRHHHHRNHHHHSSQPTSAQDRDRVRGLEKSNPYIQHPPAPSIGGQSMHSASGRHHQQHVPQGMDRKVPSYLQMTKSAASKRVPRERKHSSTSSQQLHTAGISSSHHIRKAQDKENKGRSVSTFKAPQASKTSLISSSSKWNRRLPSTSSNGSGSAFVKPVKLHHGNGLPMTGGGLLRSREPTTAIA